MYKSLLLCNLHLSDLALYILHCNVVQEELGSSVEQPKDHQQLSNSGSQDDQTTEPQQQLSLSAASDSNTTGTGMEDSGLGSADWNSMERSLEPEIPVGSGNEGNVEMYTHTV